MSPGLLKDFMDGYIKFLRLSHSTGFQSVVVTAGFLTRGQRSNPMSSLFSITHMPSFTFPSIFPRTIAEVLGTIPQRPREMTIRIIF